MTVPDDGTKKKRARGRPRRSPPLDAPHSPAAPVAPAALTSEQVALRIFRQVSMVSQVPSCDLLFI